MLDLCRPGVLTFPLMLLSKHLSTQKAYCKGVQWKCACASGIASSPGSPPTRGKVKEEGSLVDFIT